MQIPKNPIATFPREITRGELVSTRLKAFAVFFALWLKQVRKNEKKNGGKNQNTTQPTHKKQQQQKPLKTVEERGGGNFPTKTRHTNNLRENLNGLAKKKI